MVKMGTETFLVSKVADTPRLSDELLPSRKLVLKYFQSWWDYVWTILLVDVQTAVYFPNNHITCSCSGCTVFLSSLTYVVIAVLCGDWIRGFLQIVIFSCLSHFTPPPITGWQQIAVQLFSLSSQNPSITSAFCLFSSTFSTLLACWLCLRICPCLLCYNESPSSPVTGVTSVAQLSLFLIHLAFNGCQGYPMW